MRKAIGLFWLLACALLTALWLIEATGLISWDMVFNRRWSLQFADTWPGKISVAVHRRDDKPNISPLMNPGGGWSTAALAWQDKLPVARYNSKYGFDLDIDPDYQWAAPGQKNFAYVGTLYVLRVPDWALVLLWMPMTVPVALWLRRKRRDRTGKCQQCGYDLRSSPERCPECGSANIETLRGLPLPK